MPAGLVLTGAVLALCLSSYPIIFFGKSYVSPGYGPQMLYDGPPYVPGYLSTAWARYSDVDSLAEFVRQAHGVPLAAVEGEKVSGPDNERAVVAATNYELTANSTSFRIMAPGPGIVVLTEVNIPGDVHVMVNNEPGQVLTVNHAFRGVEIPDAGNYEITFTYRPELWNVALALSDCGLLILVMIVIVFSKNIRVFGNPEPSAL